ncbi:YkgJ family cysteine cluster protein [Lysobacter panacisoli]|uniref:YkgJ family cysteine cluster protein n=1 Tax=Lysobacter panacisoli TaxID=1255263 RepID=A0ABP9LKM6_9GAMM|nr:YkgJ family cysteine cluster protein [Lysobacter panacisoli]
MKPGSRYLKGAAKCTECDAVCCRLTVVLQPEDRVPSHLTTRTPENLLVMAHDEDGWCVAMDGARMNCGIYETRPAVCRRFVMNGPYCRAIRIDYADECARAIELTLV